MGAYTSIGKESMIVPCVMCGDEILSSSFKVYMCDKCFETHYYPEGRNDS